MSLLDAPVTFLKLVFRLLKGIILLPLSVAKRLYRGTLRIRTTSPASTALTLLALALAVVTGAGVYHAAQSGVEVSASSAPVVSAFLKWMTSGWGYVLAAFVFGKGTIWGVRKARIRKAAQHTGYSPKTIERAADEIRTTDGTTRSIIFGDDTLEDATEHILSSFAGDEDSLTLADASDEVEEAVDAGLPVSPDKEHPDDADDDADENRGWAERLKLWRMDLAASIRTDELVWRFGVPAAVVFVLELILVEIWVQWWLYPAMLSAAILAGIVSYKASARLRQRRLKKLRQSRGGESWEGIGVLVKTVDAEDITLHMGFLAGRRYASTNREELAVTLAQRALERARGYHPSPAIEERYAWCVDRYILSFEGWRENMEKAQIMDELVNQVHNSEEGLLPKEVLAHRVVEHDRKYIWQGLRYVGLGYDPDLVAECYDEMVPNTLVEHDINVGAPGVENASMTAVRTRSETLPPDVAQIRAAYSERFPRQNLPDRYELPEVDPDEATRGFTIPSDD